MSLQAEASPQQAESLAAAVRPIYANQKALLATE